MRSGLRMLMAAALIAGACTAPRAADRDLPPVTVVAVADSAITVNVLELFCQTCVEQIVDGCRGIEGVARVDVDLKDKLLTLHFDSARTTRELVLAAVDEVVASVP